MKITLMNWIKSLREKPQRKHIEIIIIFILFSVACGTIGLKYTFFKAILGMLSEVFSSLLIAIMMVFLFSKNFSILLLVKIWKVLFISFLFFIKIASMLKLLTF